MNMVTGKLTQTFPVYQLLNSETRKRSAGIWRYANGGIIEADYYDYNTGQIGPYKFECKYGYIHEYYIEKSTPPYYLLYEELLNTETGLAAYFANNTYVCVVYPDCLRYVDISDGSSTVFQFKPGEFVYNRMMNIGMVKTYTLCPEVPSRPYRLQMDLATFKLYLGKGVWVDIPKGRYPEIIDKLEYAQYKRLLNNPDAVAVMVDTFTGEEVFI